MTRKFLQNLGIESDLIDKIMQANGEVIEREKTVADNLREEIKKLTENISAAKKELEDYKAESGKEDYKGKLETEIAAHAETKKAHAEVLKGKEKEFSDYKTAFETEKSTAAKQSVLLKQLAADGANPKLIALLEKEFDLTKIELDGEKIKDWENISKPVKEQYADIFAIKQQKGHEPADNPGDKSGGEDDLFLKGFNTNT